MSAPFCDLYMAGDPKTKIRQPLEARILQREYAHEVAVLTLQRESRSKEQYTDGRPVVLDWGWLPDDQETFVGYIHHTEQADATNDRRELKVYCIGATYRFKDVHLRSFNGLTAPQVAAVIVKDNHFSLLADPDRFVHETLTQGGRSDWEFLVWLAKRHGMTLYGLNTEIRMLRRQVDRTVGQQHPTFTFVRGRTVRRSSAYKVTVKGGEQLPGTDKRNRMVGGVSDSGELILASHDGVVSGAGGLLEQTERAHFSQQYRERPVRSYAEADSVLQGEANLHRFVFAAEAELAGDTKVRQGSTIRLVEVDSDSNGLWYVSEADHRITRFDYRIHAQLARDTMGDAVEGTTPLVSVSGRPSIYQPADVPVTRQLLETPSSVYVMNEDKPSLERESVRLVRPAPTGWRATHSITRLRTSA